MTIGETLTDQDRAELEDVFGGRACVTCRRDWRLFECADRLTRCWTCLVKFYDRIQARGEPLPGPALELQGESGGS